MSLILVSTLVALFVFLVQQYIKNKEKLKWTKKIPTAPSKSLIQSIWSFLNPSGSAANTPEPVDPDVYFLERLLGSSVLFRKRGAFSTWFGPTPIINLCSPEAVEKVLTSNVSLEKSFDYDFAYDWFGHGLLTNTGPKWKARRKLLTPAFHFRILDEFLPAFNEQSMILAKKFGSLADNEHVDIIPLIFLCTLDVVCETMMGCPVGAQKGENSEYVDAVHNLGQTVVQRSFYPWMYADFIFYMTSMGKKFKRDLKIAHSFTENMIKKKKQQLLEERKVAEPTNSEMGTKKKKALLDMLVSMQIDGEDLTDYDIRQEIDTFMFAGHDTTAIGTIFSLYCIGLYPDVQQKIYEEIESIFGDDKERHVTMDDVKNMKYLECVLKEGQRLYPSAPVIGRKLNEDIEINDMAIPKGSAVYIHTISIHRDPNIYPDPEKFDPDRFLPENSSKRHTYSYIPFSAGPRNCIGQKFALLEEKVIVTNILRHFKIESVDPRDKVLLKVEFTLRPASPIRLKFTPR